MNEKCVISELQEWINLAEEYAKEIEEFDLICFFCAQPFEEDLVNYECELNKTPKQPAVGSRRSQLATGKSMELRTNTFSIRTGVGKLAIDSSKEQRKQDWEGFTQIKPPDIFYGNKR